MCSVKAFRKWQCQLPESHVVVLSDGSKLTTGALGWGYAIYQGRKKIRNGKGRLGIAEVFDAEVEGAPHGLQQALRTCRGLPMHVGLENTAAICSLLGEAAESSQAPFREFQNCAATASVHIHLLCVFMIFLEVPKSCENLLPLFAAASVCSSLPEAF